MSSENFLKPTPQLQSRTRLDERTFTTKGNSASQIIPQAELVTLSQAARLLPKVDGKKVSVCTLWRWCRRGLRGEHLEYTRIGRKLCTSRTALERFFNRLTELDARVQPDTRALPPSLKRPPITSRQRQRALAEADEVLKRAGI